MTELNPIYEIQEYLRTLSRYGYEIPLVIPDGIYGSLTGNAVRTFQQLVGLPQTGRVDYETWQALRAAYEEVLRLSARSFPIYPFEEKLLEGKITLGNELPLIYIIQIILRTIGIAYQNLDNQAITGIYDQSTAENVRDFQRINGLPITGDVDKETWNRLAEAYNKYLNKA
ncbi:MAG: peptidoglycan-binding protein [Ruminococcaceae bacterium]|nr:peptidoglycan-binding protein [Oscillospiraceae bacterium]